MRGAAAPRRPAGGRAWQPSLAAPHSGRGELRLRTGRDIVERIFHLLVGLVIFLLSLAKIHICVSKNTKLLFCKNIFVNPPRRPRPRTGITADQVLQIQPCRISRGGAARDSKR